MRKNKRILQIRRKIKRMTMKQKIKDLAANSEANLPTPK